MSNAKMSNAKMSNTKMSNAKMSNMKMSNKEIPHLIPPNIQIPHLMLSNIQIPHLMLSNIQIPHLMMFDTTMPNLKLFHTIMPHLKLLNSMIPHLKMFDQKMPHVRMFNDSSELYIEISFTKMFKFCLFFEILHMYSQHILIAFWHYQRVSLKCKRIALYMQRNMVSKHDFKAIIQNLPSSNNLHMFLYEFKLLYFGCLSIFRSLNSWFDNKRVIALNPDIGSSLSQVIGGGSNMFTFDEIKPYILNFNSDNHHKDYVDTRFKYNNLMSKLEYTDNKNLDKFVCYTNIPLACLLTKLTVSQLQVIAACHGIHTNTKTRHADIQRQIEFHKCVNCLNYIYIFEVVDLARKAQQFKVADLKRVKKYQEKQGQEYKIKHLRSVDQYRLNKGDVYKAANLASVKKYQEKQGQEYKIKHIQSIDKHRLNKGDVYKAANLASVKKYQEKMSVPTFPPSPPSFNLQHTIISNACKDMSPNKFMESGCAVCGRLTQITDLKKLQDDLDLNVLINNEVTQQERLCEKDPIKAIKGPVFIKELDKICKTCHKSITNGKVPALSLANGNWLGKVPDVLVGLSFTEQLLIARIRHNRCIVKVSSGMYKMRANAITFANPIPKVYDILPPPAKDLDEVLAFIYTGPCKPTKADFEKTPLLVRRNKVKLALEWLKLNHCDYYDLEISQRNLDQYPEDIPPVVIDYRCSFTNKDPESTAVNDMEDEDGTDMGKCPFVVQGLTGEEYSTKSIKALKAIALKHLTSNKKILAVGHEALPQSIYNNPQLFPQMMPWLFPYGLGGIGNSLQQKPLSDLMHKRHLLMYYDKRFQKDPYFPLIAFNHEQIKQSTTAGYLLTAKSKFEDISKRLMEVDVKTLTSLAERMEKGEKVSPETDEEKMCFQLIKDIDHVGGHVNGSVTSKKYMRHEIWSLISFIGAPSWFITFAPADSKHPISLYFADTKETFQPELRDYNERYRLIAQNPVAGARFFHFMSQMFIKHILGVNEKHPGMYGETEAYYGTVEQQGRLTLHMHMLLWIKGCLSPQEIRDKIMDPNSDFQKKMVEYLESVHIGELLTGTMDDVKEKMDKTSSEQNYQDPTQTLPEIPPPLCNDFDDNCCNCTSLKSWWTKFKYTVDDLIIRSNVHNCYRNQSNGEKASRKDKPTCINQNGKCKARFPRQTFECTEVDPKTGALNIKKGEAWINTLTPVLTYLLRCNSDVTSLLSGTAIKAIVAYISDYVTKPGLKTYTIFDVIKSVFDRNAIMLGGSMERKEKARRLITQIVNSLTAKMEIGSPMASLYLLGNPDHYTSHKFVPFYWKNYVQEAMSVWKISEDNDVIMELSEKLVLQKSNNKYVGISPVYDYVYRPRIHDKRNLYEWIQMSKRVKKKIIVKQTHDSMTESEDELDLIQPCKIEFVKPSKLSLKCNLESESEDELNIQNKNHEKFIVDDVEEEYIEKEYDSDPEQALEFLKDHPLYDTHVADFDLKKNNVVPNFIGGSLPRRNFGDREYYCATMLTLFKPWRTGKDLKAENYSWDEEFVKHGFTLHQLQLMDNFNLRYECNDARDDYSAQLKRDDSANNILPGWMSSDATTEWEGFDETEEFTNSDCIGQEDYGINKYTSLGPHGQIIKAQMDAAENSVKSAGWLDDSPDGVNLVDMDVFHPLVNQPGSKWKAVVQEKRQEILTERNIHMSDTPTSKSKNNNVLGQNNVMLVDQSYLRHDFKAKLEHAQNIIDTIVQQFSLNKEQERAFRIVANHSVSQNVEQLKMYLGGM